MSEHTGIAWTDATWNPVVGCTHASPGCDNCYADALHTMRHNAFLDGWNSAPGQYHKPFSTVQRLSKRLNYPLHWKKPRRIFVCSMADLFHPDVPEAFIHAVWATMSSAPQHTFQVLTKRPERMMSIMSYEAMGGVGVLPNVWIGVTAEDQQRADERIPILLSTPAKVRFVSVEPMLGPVDLRALLNRPCVKCGGSASVPVPGGGVACPRCFRVGQFVDPDQIAWVIAGCESGPGARRSDVEWFRSLRDQCGGAGVPFFLKQATFPVGGPTKIVKMPALDGRIWDQVPEVTT